MISLLPILKKNRKIYIYKQSFHDHSRPFEKIWSFATVFLAISCLLLIYLIEYQPTNKFISPILSSLKTLRSLVQRKHVYETFAFAPGWSYKKLDKIDYNGLTTLAYYDVPVEADGTFVYDSDGYTSFKSQEAKDLFYIAHSHGKKVFLTVSQTHNDDIKAFLRSSSSQRTLIKETINEVKDAEIDGVTIDFEYKGDVGAEYRSLFSSFVKNFTEQMHTSLPGSQVSVALGSALSKNSLYDLQSLSRVADKVFLMAYSFAVPEAKGDVLTAPTYGHDNKAYMERISEYVAAFSEDVPDGKIVIERAWYGNGANYPIYQSDTAKPLGDFRNQNTLLTPLPAPVVNRLVRYVPLKSRNAAKKNLPIIAKALEKEGILNSNVLAYALATIEHETAETFEPIDEFKGRKSARRLGYEGGTNYYGRGFIQLTHLRNYEKMGERVGLGNALAQNPDLASKPDVAAAILAAFFVDNNVSYWATQGDFVTARTPINPDRQGNWIAMLAWKYLVELS